MLNNHFGLKSTKYTLPSEQVHLALYYTNQEQKSFLFLRKAEGARLSATSTRRAGRKVVF